MMRKKAKLSRSPTFMTWFNYFSLLGQLAIVIPVVTLTMSIEMLNIFLLINALFSLRLILDSGFTVVFSRMFAQAGAGLTWFDSHDNLGVVNAKLMECLYIVSSRIYFRILFLSFCILSFIPYIVFSDIIAILPQQQQLNAVYAIIIACVVILISLYSKRYVGYLEGAGYLAEVQRMKALVNMASILLSLLVLFLFGDLLTLVIALYIGEVYYLYWLAKFSKSHRKKIGHHTSVVSDKELRNCMRYQWSKAWRSGLGVMIGDGTLQGSGLLFSQIFSASESAGYLLALRVFAAVRLVSNAPFLSQIPRFNNLYITKAMGLLRQEVEERFVVVLMLNVILMFLSFFVVIAFLENAEADVDFVSFEFWCFLVLASFSERLGALKLQYMALDNVIVWHIANGITSVVFIVLSLILYNYIGFIALAISMAFSYAFVYAMYSHYYLLKTKNLPQLNLWPLVLLIYILLSMLTVLNYV